MTHIQFLSRVTSVGDPGWPHCPSMSVRSVSQIERGDAANTYEIQMFNHFGTHMDAPNHFCAEGLKVAQLSAAEFVFQHPYLLDQTLQDSELLQPDHLRQHDLDGVDCLLIRSGFERWRDADPERYAKYGPGIGSDEASYIVQACPQIRCVILDWLSIGAFQEAQDGHLAHRILAGAKDHGRYVLGIEDATLVNLHDSPIWVVALPLRIEGVDGGPCTVIAGH